MAKFCANCGSRMEEADKICSSCGMPVADAPVKKMNVPANTRRGNGRKIIVLFCSGALLAVVAVVALNIMGNFTGYKGTIRKMVNALQKYDTEELISLTSSVSNEIYTTRYGDGLEEGYQEMVANVLDGYEENVGTIQKITYEITDVSELSDRRAEELKNMLILFYNMDVSRIQKIRNAEITLTVKGSEKSASYRVSNLFLIRENGSWKLYYGSWG